MNLLHDILDELPNDNKNIISVLSGGLDSTVLLYLLKHKYGDKVTALSFNYNQKHSFELDMAQITCQKTNTPHKIINIDFFGDLVSPVSALSNKKLIEVPKIKEVLGDPQPVTYVPYRNMLFTTLALSFAEVIDANYVCLGVQSTDLYGYWDTTPAFIHRMNTVSELNRKSQIQILAPFNNLLKDDEIRIGTELKVPFEDTWSCYNGPDENGAACGSCPTCSERIKAFMNCHRPDGVKYKRNIDWYNYL